MTKLEPYRKSLAKLRRIILEYHLCAVSIGMRNDLLPIGFAIHNEDQYTDSWSYQIIDERLIAYKYGKINEIQVQNIEKNLNTIIFAV